MVIWGFLTEVALLHLCELRVWLTQRQTTWLCPWGPLRSWGGGGLVRLGQSLRGRARTCSAGFEFPASGEAGGRTRLKDEPFEDLWGEEGRETSLSQKPGLMDPLV